MKRWWDTSAPARVTRRRIGRALMRVVMVGALSLPVARPVENSSPSGARTVCFPDGYCITATTVRLPRTGGAVIQAWAFGTLSGATQPDSPKACDLDHVCALAISSGGGAGTGTGTTIKTSFETSSQGEPSPNLQFALTETIDYAHPVTKRAQGDNGGGACYPGSGVMAIAIDASSVLVLDIVGQACQVGSNTAQLVFTGSYVPDAASTGTAANADGIGTVNINNPSGLVGSHTWMKASLGGQLIYGN